MQKDCSIYRIADLIGKRWTILILLELHKGSGSRKRYGELKASLLGITPKMLSMRLKELSRQGLVKKSVNAVSFPIKSEYGLTASGRAFIPVITGMKGWTLKWKFKNEECKSMECGDCKY